MVDWQEGIESLKEQIEDIVEGIASPDCYINVDFDKCSPKMISKKTLKDFIEKMFQEKNQNQTGAILMKSTLIDKGWEIEFALMKKSKPNQRSLGITGNGPAQIIDSVKPLRRALDLKRGRNYGELDKPFLICVNSADMYLDEESIMDTLFGTMNLGGFRITEQLQSFFIENSNFQNKSVSAIILSKDFGPYNMLNPKVHIWHNPWARIPFPVNLINLPQYVFRSTDDINFKRELILGKSMGEILDVDPTYLNRELK